MAPSNHGFEWLMVLPDAAVAAVVIERIPLGATDVIRYPSGRPWIVAQRRQSRLVSVPAGVDRHLVLFGPGTPDTSALCAEVSGCTEPAELSSIIGRLPGVFHSVLRIGNRQRLQGTACDTRRWFHRVIGHGSDTNCVVASHAHLLAGLDRGPDGTAGGGPCDVDPGVLAMYLLEPLPHPFADRPLWRGVHTVAAGHALELTRSGTARTTRWWVPPDPVIPIVEGCAALHEAVVGAVGVHLAGRTVISTELSGGIDSTAVTAVAAGLAGPAGVDRLRAITARSRDPLDDDGHFADAAGQEIGGIEHVTLDPEELPLVYADLLDINDGVPVLDAPSMTVTHRARVRAVLAPARDIGSEVHLTGHGGDHLFVGHPTLSRDLLCVRPRIALRLIHAYRGLFGWLPVPMLRQLFATGSYARWMRTAATTRRILDYRYPLLTWGVPAALHPWLTAYAVSEVRTQLAAGAEPLAPSPGRHAELNGVREGGRMVRALADSAASGAPLVCAPLLDDRVLEATLAVRIEDRADPWTYKPLLRRAMAYDLPRAIAARTTKGVGSLDEALGRALHREAILALLNGSRLADLGLIDESTVHRLPTERPELADGGLLSTLACEAWLRSLDRLRPAGPLPPQNALAASSREEGIDGVAFAR